MLAEKSNLQMRRTHLSGYWYAGKGRPMFSVYNMKVAAALHTPEQIS